ncbi:MAG TPA: response regulator [Gammaproteobacteria bacterium]|nr:response regulator [Gammaproteobacteria bacterium]
MINIIVADNKELDDKEVLSAFENNDIRIIEQCMTSGDALAAVKTRQPDLVVMSLALGGLGSFEAIDQIRMNHPKIGIVIMLIHSNGPFPKRLLETGATGFISKNTSPEDMVNAIRHVAQREKYISPEIAQKIAISLLPGGETSPLDRLSEREMQVMLQLSQGDSPLQISSRLALSPKTVSTYKHRVRDKLRVDDTQEIYALAGSHGLVYR